MRDTSENAGLRIGSGLFLIVVGLVYGMLTSAVNHGFGPGSAYVSKVLGDGSVWLAVGLAVCLAGRTWAVAALRGLAFYLPAVGAYYVADVVAGVYHSPPLSDPFGPARFDVTGLALDVVLWVVFGSVTSALLAVLVVLIRRGGVLGIVAAVAVPAYIAYSALTLYAQQRTWNLALDPISVEMNLLIGVSAAAVAVVVALRSGGLLLVRKKRGI